MKGRLSPVITILSSICLGFLLGIIFSKMVYNNLDLLTFEKFVFEFQFSIHTDPVGFWSSGRGPKVGHSFLVYEGYSLRIDAESISYLNI